MDFGTNTEGMGHSLPENPRLPSETREEEPEQLFLRLQGKLIQDLAKSLMEIYGIPLSYRHIAEAILAGIASEDFNGKTGLFRKLRSSLFEENDGIDKEPIMNDYFYERLCSYLSDGGRIEEILHVAGFLFLQDLIIFYGPEFCRRAAEAQIPMSVSSIQGAAQHAIMRAANGTHS